MSQDLDFAGEARRITKMIVTSNKVVALTGAGISTESGIPDFRGPDGLWKRVDPSLATIQSFRLFPEVFWYFMIKNVDLILKAKPNRAHYALAELERMGRLSSIITQNVDGLHFKAGSRNVIELHGNAREAVCLSCGNVIPLKEALKMAKRSYFRPFCKKCGGPIKPNVVLFNEPLPQEILERAIWDSRTCDFMLVVGTSLQVYPAAHLPEYAKLRGAKVAIINEEPTPFDNNADIVICAKAGRILPIIASLVKKALL
jgi:NAD-dependent deacetylase